MTMSPEQCACQAYTDALGIKKGDTVLIRRIHASHNYGWTDAWTPKMDRAVGKEGIVEAVGTSANGFFVRVSGNSHWFPPYSVEQVGKRARPYNQEELVPLCGKLLQPRDSPGKPSLVLEATYGGVSLVVGASLEFVTPDQLLKEWVHEDGSVCGVQE